MKKIYQKPTTEIVEVQMESMLAASEPNVAFGDDYNGQDEVLGKSRNGIFDSNWDLDF